MPPRSPVAALLVLGALAAATPAAASGPASSLSWVELPGAESCGGAPTIARAVEARLGRSALMTPSQAGQSIEVRVEHPPGTRRWVADVALRDPAGRILGNRRFESEGETCDDLRASAALGIALMIDPEAALRRPAPPPVPAPPVEPAPAEKSAAGDDLAPRPGLPPWIFRPAAGFALGFGVLPSVATGVRIELTIRPRRFLPIVAFGGAWISQDVTAESAASARFSLLYGGAGVCPLQAGGDDRVSLNLCAGPEVGLSRVQTTGFASDLSTSGATVDAVAWASLVFPIAHGLSVRLGGQAGIRLHQDKSVYTDASGGTRILFDPPPVNGACDLGLAVAIP